MSFATRLKKLTNYIYSPTDPASEDSIREEIDDSIQEVYDNTQAGLADTTGAAQVGYSGGYATVETALEAFESGGSGTIPPDDSITLAKQNDAVKTGLLAALATTVKTDLVSAINEVDGNTDTNATNLNMNRTAKTATGTADAAIVTTDGTFDLTRDGNILPFTPFFNNTGGYTVNPDGQGDKTVEKYVDGAYSALEADDIKKLQHTFLAWNLARTAFQLAPKGGAILKSPIQRGVHIWGVETFIDIGISLVDTNSSVVIPNGSNISNNKDDGTIKYELTSGTNVRLTRVGNLPMTNSTTNWQVVEFNNVKSKQTGDKTVITNRVEENVGISPIDDTKSLIFSSMRNTNIFGISANDDVNHGARIKDGSNIGTLGTNTQIISWQVIEFN